MIDAKKETLGQNLTTAEDQITEYAEAKLKWVQSDGSLPFLYEATGIITRFTDQRDPKPRSREVFSFHRLETLRAWLVQGRPHSSRAEGSRHQKSEKKHPRKRPLKGKLKTGLIFNKNTHLYTFWCIYGYR